MIKRLKFFLIAVKLLFILICFAGPFNGFGAESQNVISGEQQTKVITGTVTDNNMQPLPGASVIVKGTTFGSITDSEGKFTLRIPENAKTLVVSFVGMIPQELQIGTKATFNVALQQEDIGLEEVVAVGYGTVRKKDLTGSVSSISSGKLAERSSFSAAQAMQGKAAGVVVQQTNAAPGADAKVMIRGNRSLKATNDPLYVVDGVPLVVGLSEISQSDIESIDILKDASATAIYGSRGANGVVLITTKKGKSGKAVVDYNGYYGVQTQAKELELFNGPEWVEFLREAYRTTGKYPIAPTYAMDTQMMPVGQENDPAGIAFKIQSAYDADGSWHPERLVSTDWMGEVMRQGQVQNHEVSVRGGTEKLKVLSSATYYEEKGLLKTQDYSRYSVRVNFDWDISDYVTIGGQTQFSHFDRNDGPNVYDGVKSISPLANIRNADGQLFNRPGNDPQLWNPVLNLTEAIVRYKKDRFLGSYYVEAKLPFDVKFRSNVGLDFGPYADQRFYGGRSSDRQGGKARAENGGDTRTMYTWENLLYWNKLIKSHSLGATFLQSIQQEKFESSRINVLDLPYESQLWYNVGSSPSISAVSSNYRKWQLASFMGRFNYSYKDKYLLTASARYDGASRLAPGRKWVMFPSAALAWRINEEDFMKNTNIFSNLKLRAGYGITGNSAIDPYKTAGNLGYARYNFGSTNMMAFYQNEMPNPDLKWEKTKQYNAGVDFGILKGRINGVVDVYLQNTSDLLMDRQLPQVAGFNSVVYNIGKTRNKGVEVTINTYNIQRNDFSWSTDFIFARNKEEIVELYGGKNDDIGNRWFIGQPLQVYYDYKSLGIWQLGEEAEMAKYGTQFKPGMIKVADNGDDKITAADQQIIGSTRPKFTASISNYFTYKSFDLNFFFNASYGNMLQFDRNMSFNGRYNSLKVNYWRVTEYDATGNAIASNGSNEAPRPNNGIENPNFRSSLNYFNASFLRLSNATLGYNLPQSILVKAKLSKLRLYTTIQNAFCITKYPGTDPESGENFNAPMPRTIMFGINMSL
ncbi:MAG TPA: TonB-dependent receptor [Prolixibacteraceae bacterium]|nr:TonB-dependent receptor [Prolixibacteraceae bacterium]